MTPNEFKAWFDGFTEAFTGTPTKAQWSRIRDRVAEIDGEPVTQTVYMDRYIPSYPYLRPYWHYCGNAAGVGASNNAVLSNTAGAQYQAAAHGTSFNSMQAMADLGRAEAKGVA